MKKIWNGKLSGLISAAILLLSILFEKLLNFLTTFLFTSNIKCGKNVKVMKGVVYRYPQNIKLGDGVIIGNNTSLSSEGLTNHYLNIGPKVSIGNNCKIDFSGGIIINNEAQIAHHVLISTHDHSYDYRNKPVGHPLEIGENAFKGLQSIIMHNVSYIGENAVAGTGAVVTKDIPDNAVLV